MNMTTMEAYVNRSTQSGISTVEFFHPQSNSLPSAILNKLAEEILNAGKDPETRVILLRSGGSKAFCAGASFDELTRIDNESDGKIFFSGFAKVINAIRTCGKIVIARIQGKCVGGGVGLAAAADYSIAVQGADVKLSELAVGIGPFVVGPAIERKMGVSAFSAMAIDASMWRSSEWAYQRGLFAECHPGMEEVDAAVMRLAGFLVNSSPDALAEMKQIFWKGTEHWASLLEERAGISGRLVIGSHAKKAIAAALSKTTK
jgi:methylglutaconyl-CoA hydratase